MVTYSYGLKLGGVQKNGNIPSKKKAQKNPLFIWSTILTTFDMCYENCLCKQMIRLKL